jgi:hypothetical protein
LPALEKQLAASCHEVEEVHLQEVLLMEDRERAVVAGICQGLCRPRRCATSHKPGPPWSGAWIFGLHRASGAGGTSR